MLAMLSLALLPIGLIAVNQTKQVANTARENAELVLLTRTENASFEERIVIEQARGAARMLGALQGDLDQAVQCGEYLRAFVEANIRFSFIGVLPKDGQMTCSSSDQSFDFSEFENFEDIMATEKATVTVNQKAPLSGRSVIIVSEPFFRGGVFQGVVSVSIPHSRLQDHDEDAQFRDLANVITFNRRGEVLTSGGDLDAAYLDTPMGMTLDALAGRGAFAFSALDKLGQQRIFSVVPIIKGSVYTLGIWDADTQAADRFLDVIPAWIFPGLMWLVSLVVALLAVHRLVIRHVRGLGKAMREFARDRTLHTERAIVAPSTELAEMEDDFRLMADVVLQDEAALENSLRDKNVLLKEVHHRVKNNLQLISSIMNMQMRRATSPETKAVLARLQDRVLSLATIHRDLYQSQSGGRVDAGSLVTEIVEKSVEIGEDETGNVTRRLDIDPIKLFPDQAVPLSLLMAEASTNAMKYIGPDKSGARWVKVSLKVGEDNHCRILFENSIGSARAEEIDSTGLGSQLINAFAMQLCAQLEASYGADCYTMTLDFQIQEFIAENVDY